jgi:hypothetical protein
MVTVIATKVDDGLLAEVDVLRGSLTRSAWVKELIVAACGVPVVSRGEGGKVNLPSAGRFGCCRHCKHGPNQASHGAWCSQGCGS